MRLIRSDKPRLSQFHPNNILTHAVKGLYNPIGAYNCFVNVVIQILWNLDSFRNTFLSIDDRDHRHNDQRTCVFCAFKNLFTNYAFSEQSCLVPQEIRETLSYVYQPTSQFQLYQMDDASEVFVCS